MTSLRDDVASILSGAPFPSARSLAKADAIIQLITTRLTSEEAVEAFHTVYERFGQLGDLKCQRIADDHVRTAIQAAIGRAVDA